ncbi:MAG: thioredoxin domain-containing protein [Acidobacteriales bacterium]|nr:thioredoxin domain-containing protein [Terriglobales bacterium]
MFFLLVLLTSSVFAQDDSSKRQILKPPAGAKVAIISFEDFECPDCGRAHPLLVEMSKKYSIPLVRHDFPLPQHPWAMQAALINRYIESKNPKLASEYRDQVYANQPQFGEDADKFRTWAMQWASSHGVPIPFVIDPEGKFKEAIDRDRDLGRRINIEHTPTIYVVTNSPAAQQPFVEVVDRTQLAQIIEDAKRAAGPDTAPTHTRTAHRTKKS